MENDSLSPAVAQGATGANPVADLVPDSVKESPAFAIAGVIGWFLYQHRGRIGGWFSRVRGKRS